ncbi:hypothetical protein QUB60_25120 [Microcoleus sp. A2-C5]
MGLLQVRSIPVQIQLLAAVMQEQLLLIRVRAILPLVVILMPLLKLELVAI